MDLRTIGLALSEVSGDARKDLERNQSRFTGGTVISSGGHLVGLHVLYGRKANPLGIALALDARRAFHIPRYFWKTSVKANGPLRTATGQFDSGSVQRNDPCQTNIHVLIGGAISLQTSGVTAVMTLYPTTEGCLLVSSPICLP